MEGILIGGLVGIIIVCAIEVAHGYFFDTKMKKAEELHKHKMLAEVEWMLWYAGASEPEIEDMLAYLSYRWEDGH